MDNNRVDAIEKLLPQTQCCRCGYSGCRGYAEALAQGAQIDRCPPGGEHLIEILRIELNADAVATVAAERLDDFDLTLALIDEDNCIGCTKCIQVCPTAAITGGQGAAHTVIADLCTGCMLCQPVCPTNCIDAIADATSNRNAPAAQTYNRRTAEFLRHKKLKEWVAQWPLRRHGVPAATALVPSQEMQQQNTSKMRVNITAEALQRARQQKDATSEEQMSRALQGLLNSDD